jgi:RNA polymerase sigma-70 factor (ECF subfamily)
LVLFLLWLFITQSWQVTARRTKSGPRQPELCTIEYPRGLKFDRAKRDIDTSLALPNTDYNEQLLVLGLRARSELAYEELDRRYRTTIERVAFKYLDRNDVPDAIQQVLMRVYANIHQFRGESSLKRWILRIVYGEIRQQRRSQELRKDKLVGYDEPSACLADPRPGVLEMLCHREMDEEVELALLRVEPTLRNIILLRDFEGWSYEAIGNKLGVTTATVLTGLNRGRVALRRALVHTRRFKRKVKTTIF